MTDETGARTASRNPSASGGGNGEQADHLEPASFVAGTMRLLADALEAHRVHINRLNVYPVPDGDTGSNMLSTVRAAVEALDGLGSGAVSDPEEVFRAVAQGSLMGARGNSGVILSQIVRGLVDVFSSVPQLDAKAVADALVRAAEGAYSAVMKPVEGTVLTVAREAAEAAVVAKDASGSVLEVLENARIGAATALEKTPTLLPVLGEAGVVDAGGVGYVLLLDSMLSQLDGRPLPPPGELEGMDEDVADLVAALGGEAPHDAADGPRYEVMFLLDAPDDRIDAFKDVWAGVGDSIVVVGGSGLWNCHIHTDDIGAAIEAALDVGRPRNIRVTDLAEQVEEQRWVAEAGQEEPPLVHDEPAVTAVVAVCNGGGLRRILHSLGVHRIVTGGQSANPSTEELLRAVEEAPSDSVILLPNNKNVVPVARQVGRQTEKRVEVVETHNISEGFAALVAYDPQAGLEENLASMAEAASQVLHLEVCRAVRDAPSSIGPIRAGDWIAIGPDGIVSASPDLEDCVLESLDKVVSHRHEVVTVIEGEGASTAVTRRITGWLEASRPDVEYEVHHGGQPLYPYLFGIE